MNIELEQVDAMEVTDDALELASYCNLSTGIPPNTQLNGLSWPGCC